MFAKKWKSVRRSRDRLSVYQRPREMLACLLFTSREHRWDYHRYGLGLSPSFELLTVFSGAMALSTGVTPLISGTKRMAVIPFILRREGLPTIRHGC